MVTATGALCVPAMGGTTIGRWRALTSGWWAWHAAGRDLEMDWRLRQPRMVGSWRAMLEDVRKANPDVGCLLWEATQLAEKPFLARQMGWRVIAAPQNLECLLRPLPDGRRQRSARLRLLEREVESLAEADSVFCVSEEDAWLLRGLGLAARVLPYFPPPILEARLLDLRRRRDVTPPEGPSVLVGSIGTPQAARGFRCFLTELDAALAVVDQSVIVIGLGTDRERPPGLSARISCRGWVDDETLDELLLQARAVIANQEFGTGALTRVPEALLSGLPVIGNRMALRSARHHDGVYCYDSRDELCDLLRIHLPMPSLPMRPTAAERLFTQELLRLASV